MVKQTTQPETEVEKQAREVVETIATTIAQLSRSVNALLGGRLKRKSLVLLLAHSSGLPQYQVNRVLEAIAGLEREHLQ